ncbi:MAG: indole-3-glycerol phosphate synthase TrpC [Lachnospiraceae bacterium]|nr:indole-3-glycerol phosphate synthase TrpC [Lachnospiraceae bacterium]
MGNILETIAEDTRKRIALQKERIPLRQVQEKAEQQTGAAGRFQGALQKEGLSFICEVKKASPSKGVMVKDFQPLAIAGDYLAAGADALSVLTEPKYFLGADAYLKEIVSNVELPALRKDFTVDEYMLYEAKALGASAVLLIVAILPQEDLVRYLRTAEKLGLDALVETHDGEEIRRAADAGAKIIGINNRDLKDFSVSIEHSIALRHLIPEEAVFVSESGIHTEGDIRRLKECGTDAVLVGEAMVTSIDKAGALERFRNA